MFDFLVGCKSVATGQTFAASPNRRSSPRRARIDYFVLFTTAFDAPHNTSQLQRAVAVTRIPYQILWSQIEFLNPIFVFRFGFDALRLRVKVIAPRFCFQTLINIVSRHP